VSEYDYLVRMARARCVALDDEGVDFAQLCWEAGERRPEIILGAWRRYRVACAPLDDEEGSAGADPSPK